MSFSHARGSRGARRPKGRLLKWLNAMVMRRIRRRGGSIGGMNALVLTTVGRKSGERRSTPVGWFPGPGGRGWVVVASAAGAATNPAWYLNLAARSDDVVVELAGRPVAVTARELSGSEREETWARILEQAPRFAQYETKTDRVIPIILLTPRDED